MTEARSDPALALVFTLLVLLFSLSRQVVTEQFGGRLVGTLFAAVVTFFAAWGAAKWARSAHRS